MGHHEACQVIANGDTERQIFLSYPHKNNQLFFFLSIVKGVVESGFIMLVFMIKSSLKCT